VRSDNGGRFTMTWPQPGSMLQITKPGFARTMFITGGAQGGQIAVLMRPAGTLFIAVFAEFNEPNHMSQVSDGPFKASRPRRARAKPTLSSDAQRHCERGPVSDAPSALETRPI
jgi:hypothetical protein